MNMNPQKSLHSGKAIHSQNRLMEKKCLSRQTLLSLTALTNSAGKSMVSEGKPNSSRMKNAKGSIKRLRSMEKGLPWTSHNYFVKTCFNISTWHMTTLFTSFSWRSSSSMLSSWPQDTQFPPSISTVKAPGMSINLSSSALIHIASMLIGFRCTTREILTQLLLFWSGWA